jgi:DNA-binding NtrC family response regulator
VSTISALPGDALPRALRLWSTQARPDSTAARAGQPSTSGLVGASRTFRGLLDNIPLLARCDAIVLITGETGTGKDLFARAIHDQSPRAARPFVPINCGAVPMDLIENELFGHARGAFTGATPGKQGLLREAEGGSLFLDEIDSLPLSAQVKLLHFLQQKEYRSLGATRISKADVRIIAATHADLPAAVRAGRFRQDLYFRLNIIPLALPPLRERQEDIPALARHFLHKHARLAGKAPGDFTPRALHRLVQYRWPGNVRELEHCIERAVIFARQALIDDGDLDLSEPAVERRGEPFQQAKARHVAQFEQGYLRDLLIQHQGNVSRAARAAQKDRRALWQLIQKHGINVHTYRPAKAKVDQDFVRHEQHEMHAS